MLSFEVEGRWSPGSQTKWRSYLVRALFPSQQSITQTFQSLTSKFHPASFVSIVARPFQSLTHSSPSMLLLGDDVPYWRDCRSRIWALIFGPSLRQLYVLHRQGWSAQLQFASDGRARFGGAQACWSTNNGDGTVVIDAVGFALGSNAALIGIQIRVMSVVSKFSGRLKCGIRCWCWNFQVHWLIVYLISWGSFVQSIQHSQSRGMEEASDICN